MDAVMRSALMSGICNCGASRSFHSVVLPLPLWPARTKAVGLLLARDCLGKKFGQPWRTAPRFHVTLNLPPTTLPLRRVPSREVRTSFVASNGSAEYAKISPDLRVKMECLLIPGLFKALPVLRNMAPA